MQQDLIYRVNGEEILAKVSDGASCVTQFARVTLHREACEESVRLTVASTGELLPEAQAQSNTVAERVARQNQKTEDWVAVLERAHIHLQGSSTELRCSVVIDDSVLPKEESACDGLFAMACNI